MVNNKEGPDLDPDLQESDGGEQNIENECQVSIAPNNSIESTVDRQNAIITKKSLF